MSRKRVVLRNRAARARQLALPLRTQRLSLRDFREEDFEAMCGYALDPRVTRYLFLAPRTVEEAREHFRRILGWQTERPREVFELAIELQTQAPASRLAGACNLTLVAPGEADIGYMLHHDFWRQGFATEIACALRDAAFGHFGRERVISTIDVRNEASMRVIEKAGLRWEATYRKFRQARGQWRDCHLFSMPRVAWESAR
jgi:ribosomal-protein-alanine N-acetyltransferase